MREQTCWELCTAMAVVTSLNSTKHVMDRAPRTSFSCRKPVQAQSLHVRSAAMAAWRAAWQHGELHVSVLRCMHEEDAALRKT